MKLLVKKDNIFYYAFKIVKWKLIVKVQTVEVLDT